MRDLQKLKIDQHIIEQALDQLVSPEIELALHWHDWHPRANKDLHVCLISSDFPLSLAYSAQHQF